MARAPSIAALLLLTAPLACAVPFHSGRSPSHTDRAGLQKAEDAYTEGVATGNVKLLASVWANTFVDTDEEGGFSTRETQLGKVAASTTTILSLHVDQEHVDFYGTTAVVTERFRVAYVVDGKRGTETGRATDVWVDRSGRWLCVAAHSSAIPTQ